MRRTVLPGGVRVLTEQMPSLRSATLGAWVGVGSRDETSGHHGSTHFLEHLLFKGTTRRSAFDIAEAFDAVGGEANAVTGKEHTCYFARVLDNDLPMAVDVIGDMVTSATITPEDLDAERGVILEELAMNDDDPADVAHERFSEQVLGDHPLGRPIGGTPESIRAVTRDAVWDHYQQHYRPAGLVVTAAGGVDHDRLCEQVVEALRHDGWPVDDGVEPLAARPAGDGSGGFEPVGADAGSVLTVKRSTEQAHLLLGGLGICSTDPRRYAMSVLNAVLGGGMSSRLFQEVREKRGLAYSVYSFSAAYSDSGYFGMYAGCTPARVGEVVDLLTSEWARLADRPGRRRRARARHRPAQRRPGAGHGGHRLADVAAGQGRAGLRRVRQPRRVAAPDPRRHRRAGPRPGRRAVRAAPLAHRGRPVRRRPGRHPALTGRREVTP